MLNLKKKKRPTYLPKLKLMGRSTANKNIFKDGPIITYCIISIHFSYLLSTARAILDIV